MLSDTEMARRIKVEREKYEADEEVIHNRMLHKRILETWRMDSPQMVERLIKLRILDDLAFVSQERMWRQAKLYRQGGMQVTDAREQAEREHLMLEPEMPEVDDTDLPEVLQDGPQYLKDRWRAERDRLNGSEL